MKILFITGKLAYEGVKEVVKQIKDIEADILNLGFPVASLMTVEYIAERLKGIPLKEYDYIILPGLVSGDAKKIEEVTKIKSFKGTEDYRDIPLIIEALNEGITLSTIYPADVVLGKIRRENIIDELSEIEDNGDYAFEVNGVKIPKFPPPFRLFIEVDASKDINFLLEEADRVKKFVHVIVLGFPNGHEDTKEVKDKVKKIKEEGYTVGIDSASERELIEGAKAGADFIFNLNEENVEKLEEIKDKAFVIAPLSSDNRAETTYKIYEKAKSKKFEKLILDPILSPPMFGFVDSIVEYKKLRSLTDAPMLMGLLNVTELIDADSVGINALLTTIAGEIGVGNLLIMDRNKTRWSSYETNVASKMVSLAIKKKILPKDLGIDLLILKDKKVIKKKEDEYNSIEVSEHIEPKYMDNGYVKIMVGKEKINLEWIGKEKIRISGKDGLSIGRKLLELANINTEHALYIGYELAKAEIALQLDKNYIQDEPLFKRGYISISTYYNRSKERQD